MSTTSPAATRPDLAGMVHDLCLPITHRERYQIRRTNGDGTATWLRQYHTTQHPSLVLQLYGALEASTSVEEGIRPGFDSKPTVRIDAIDAATRIDIEAARWVQTLRNGDRGSLPPSTVGRILRVHGSVAHRPEHLRDVTRDVARWWTQARVLTGWDSPAWRPDASCPACAERGGLRVKLAAHSAVCVECWETWDTATIGLLADHIRVESSDAPTPTPVVLNRHRGRDRRGDVHVGPCQCRGCGHPDRVLVLCPDCGGSGCAKAAHHGWPCAGGPTVGGVGDTRVAAAGA